jgi:hypothetical protein
VKRLFHAPRRRCFSYGRRRIGASFNLIRVQLGHAFLETTLIYAQSMPSRGRR